MLIVGLTGGIASGKTTATEFFSSLGVPVLDADLIVHELLKPGTASYAEIIHVFGPDIVQNDGELNRKKLRQLIFSDIKLRQQLESLLHPEVRKVLKNQLNKTQALYCIVSIPLLVETHQQDLMHRILVIDTPEETQIQRLQQRNDFSSAEIKAILAAQATRDERLAAADDVIVNNTDIESFKDQLKKIHQTYVSLTKKPANS